MRRRSGHAGSAGDGHPVDDLYEVELPTRFTLPLVHLADGLALAGVVPPWWVLRRDRDDGG